MYTEEELQETIEWLEEVVMKHEDALSSLVWALIDEENLSESAKDNIRDAYKVIYGDRKKPK